MAGCSDDEPRAQPTTETAATAAESEVAETTVMTEPASAEGTAAEASDDHSDSDHDHDDHDDHDHDDSDHGDASAPDEQPESPDVIGRLLIGDGETGALSVLDLPGGELSQDAFDLGARATRLYPTTSGRFAIAVATDANDVHVFDGGIYLEAHGDHMDLVSGDLSAVDVELAGERPVHLYVSSNWSGLFYDGSGDVAFLNERDLADEGGSYDPHLINVGSHHGAVVPLDGDLFAVSLQHPDYESSPEEYALPIGAQIVNVDGDVLHEEHGCDGLHGNGGNGTTAVFGCIGGALFVETHGSAYSGGFVSAPEGAPEGFRLGSVWGYHGLDHFFGQGSTVGLWVVHPDEGTMELLIPASESRNPTTVAFSHDGSSLLVVMSNGELRSYDAVDLRLQAVASGFLAAPMETGFWTRPNVATAPGAVFVTDAVSGNVFMLDSDSLEVVETWNVAGSPNKVAFVGVLEEHEDHH